jgi:hypothetical protein
MNEGLTMVGDFASDQDAGGGNFHLRRGKMPPAGSVQTIAWATA